jgi:hypothetical protein
LRLPDFVHPFNSHGPAFEVNQTRIKVAAGVDEPPRPLGFDAGEMGHPTSQDTIMFRDFAKQVSSGKLNEEWPAMALKTQQVMDACFRSACAGGREMSLTGQ